MSGAWLAPAPIEPLVADPEAFTTNIFALRGDSMILVDRTGRRVANEKLAVQRACLRLPALGPGDRRVPQPPPLHGVRRRHRSALRRREERQPAAPARTRTPHTSSPDTRSTSSPSGWRNDSRAPTPRSPPGSASTRPSRPRSRTRSKPTARTRARASTAPSAVARRRSSCSATARPVPGNDRNPAMYPVRPGRALPRDHPRARDARHEGRPGDRPARPRARRRRSTDPRPLCRRQLRRLPLGAGLLGGRRHRRARDHVRLPRRPARGQVVSPACLVTGAGSGIGAGVAERLLERGHGVACLDVRPADEVGEGERRAPRRGRLGRRVRSTAPSTRRGPRSARSTGASSRPGSRKHEHRRTSSTRPWRDGCSR